MSLWPEREVTFTLILLANRSKISWLSDVERREPTIPRVLAVFPTQRFHQPPPLHRPPHLPSEPINPSTRTSFQGIDFDVMPWLSKRFFRAVLGYYRCIFMGVLHYLVLPRYFIEEYRSYAGQTRGGPLRKREE